MQKKRYTIKHWEKNKKVRRGTVKRLVAWGLILLTCVPMLYYALILTGFAIPIYWGNPFGLRPQKLEKMLAEEGCFYNAQTEHYQTGDLPFGASFPETVEVLGLENWYSEKQYNAEVAELKGLKEQNTISTVVNTPRYASIFDAHYRISFNFSQNAELYRVGFNAGFIDVPFNSGISWPEPNVLDYSKSVAYIAELYSSFVSAYGNPAYSNFETDLMELASADAADADTQHEVVAYWLSEEDGITSVLGLEGRTLFHESQDGKPYLGLGVDISVAQTVEGINWEDIVFRMSSLRSEEIPVEEVKAS